MRKPPVSDSPKYALSREVAALLCVPCRRSAAQEDSFAVVTVDSRPRLLPDAAPRLKIPTPIKETAEKRNFKTGAAG